MPKKIEWTKPQLIVLSRGTPEEAVLMVCKQQPREYPNPQSGAETIAQTNCNQGAKLNKDNAPICGSCQGVTGS